MTLLASFSVLFFTSLVKSQNNYVKYVDFNGNGKMLRI